MDIVDDVDVDDEEGIVVHDVVVVDDDVVDDVDVDDEEGNVVDVVLLPCRVGLFTSRDDVNDAGL